MDNRFLGGVLSADRTLLEGVARNIIPADASLEHLGTGGFACTFKVTRGSDICALKVIDPGIADAKRVERELAAMQRVRHPGVVRFRSFGTHSQDSVTYRWIEMDFVAGHTLGSALNGGQVFSPAEAIALLRRLVEAAAAIWEEGTAHRDLSPGNIMLTNNDLPVIVDLGMARHVDDETLTLLPTPGTPGWMSPEQVSATPTHGDWRSDQFVLGAIGYALLTQVAPFYAPSIMDRWLAPAVQTPRSIRAIDPDIPNSVADVIERMIRKQPHRRYLQVRELLADLERAASALVGTEPQVERNPGFFVNIGQIKNWAEDDFLSILRPVGTVIDIQAGARVEEFVDAARAASSRAIVDPATPFARSPLEFRSAGYKKLPYGEWPTLTGFADETARAAWCGPVWEAECAEIPDIVIGPYFYAGAGEMSWIQESLACARTFSEFASEAEDAPIVWAGLLIHSEWLADDHARDQLLTELTGQSLNGLYLLVHTSQPSFGPLADSAVLRGFRDLFEVMQDANIPVVVGKRASSGLLLLALGADGWSSGVSANLMNSAPHPEAPQDGGPSLDRVYVPKLMTLVTVSTYTLMRRTKPELVELETDQAAALLAQNPDLENLTTTQRVLLLRHNLIAQRSRVVELSAMPAGQRISKMREWVKEAMSAFSELPPHRIGSEGSGFLTAWERALS